MMGTSHYVVGYWDIRRCMSVIQNIEVSVSEGLICETFYRHAFETFDVPRFSGVQHKGIYFTIFRGCGLTVR